MNQSTLNISIGAGGAIIAYAFGAWSGMLELFFLAMGLDYISGVAASLKEKKGLNSQVGFWGLVKKLMMLFAVLFGHRADLAFDTNYIMVGILCAFLANELVSLGENYGRIGLPFAQYLNPIVAILRQKGGTSDAIQKSE